MTYTKRRTFREGGAVAGAYNIRSIGKTLAVVALASSAALGLSGCGTSGSPGTAFIVNDQSFSERDLSETITQFARISGTEVPRDQMVDYLVLTNLRLQAAEDAGVALTDEDVQTTIDGALASLDTTLTASQIVRPVRDMFRDGVLISMVQSGEISNQQIATMDAYITDSRVTLNPRYGAFVDGQVNAPGDLGDAISGTLTEAVG